jgi:hypothetical protein
MKLYTAKCNDLKNIYWDICYTSKHGDRHSKVRFLDNADYNAPDIKMLIINPQAIKKLSSFFNCKSMKYPMYVHIYRYVLKKKLVCVYLDKLTDQ